VSPSSGVRRRRQSFVSPSVMVLIVVVGALLTLTGLWAVGVINLERLFGPSHEGMVAIPMPAREIPAYTKITRDHLIDPTGKLSLMYLPPDAVTPQMYAQLGEILGRVTKKAKPPGYVFTETDFLPKGSRDGLVAAVPPGKRAMRIEADQVKGLYGLHIADRFDLVATIPIESKAGTKGLKIGGAYQEVLALQAELTNWMKQATVRVLVQNGQLVQPLITRQVPISANTLQQGAVTRMRPIQEYVIAVDPQEVALLTQAIAVKAQINAVPRSGQPGDVEDSRTPDLQPWHPYGGLTGTGDSASDAFGKIPKLTMVETIAGHRKKGLSRGVLGVPMSEAAEIEQREQRRSQAVIVPGQSVH
jgi:Flp pilus assembly protein CpaB